ncbi:DKNYY domain-containing protein [Candidatus Absconditicoccus praedator]|uniref:DKNYY domain-containing protein n=1 Tax=Candidatus Absconditicoccus praedator TaxID=2735562 RepID=UPI001E3D7416|nr:DKNYY domain-containing protein [Candidatus Absconditicoccus praedator]UFX83405.1 DKNYY domain-containing protein [Candidatus Absconditicoccus praedator]
MKKSLFPNLKTSTKLLIGIGIFLYLIIVYRIVYVPKDFGRHYSKNFLYVYYEGNMIDGADPISFEVFRENLRYAKDKNNVYYRGEIQEKKDQKTFELLGCSRTKCYGKDTENVYFNNKLLEGFNSNDVFYIGDLYLGYEDNVYYKGELVEGADLNTFRYTLDGYRKDDYNKYYKGEKIR